MSKRLPSIDHYKEESVMGECPLFPDPQIDDTLNAPICEAEVEMSEDTPPKPT